MLVAENGVLGVEVFNKSEAIEDALFDLQCTEEYNKIWKKFLETKDEEHSNKLKEKLVKMENDYLIKKGLYEKR